MCDLRSVFNLLTEIVAQVGAPLILAHTSFRDLLIMKKTQLKALATKIHSQTIFKIVGMADKNELLAHIEKLKKQNE
jgi:hypothetical protein